MRPDTNLGEYIWSASPAGWQRVGDLTRELVMASNTSSGDANAVTANSDRPFSHVAYGALITVNFTAANTGAMTLSIDGETPRPLVTNTGEPIPASYVSAGMSALVQIDGDGNYRLFSYGDAAAVQAAAEAAAAQAVAAASSVQSTQISKNYAEANYSPATAPDFIEIAGYASAGDGGGALYKKGTGTTGDLVITLSDGTTEVGYDLAGIGVKAMLDRSSISSILPAPSDSDDDWLYEDFPPAETANHGNTPIGAGIVDLGSPDMVRTTAYGSLVLTKPKTIDRVSAFGQGVLRHTKYGRRIDAFGSLTCQWGGSNLEDDASGKFYHHDLIYNGGGALLVEGSAGSYTLNAAWTASNLFGLSGTVGQSIVDWLNTNPWPTVDTDFSYIQALGRDALCEIVKGTKNVAYGYRALASFSKVTTTRQLATTHYSTWSSRTRTRHSGSTLARSIRQVMRTPI